MQATPQPCKRQCFRCQRWGHISYGCQFGVRCVRCGKDHRSKDCTKPKDVPANCANCQSSHPASYRGCPAAPKSRRSRRRPPSCRGCQNKAVEDAPREALSKLVTAITKLLVKKDFFSEEQMAVIAAELDDRPSTAETSSQCDPTPMPCRVETSVQCDPAPLPSRVDVATQTGAPETTDAGTQTDLPVKVEPPPPKQSDSSTKYVRTPVMTRNRYRDPYRDSPTGPISEYRRQFEREAREEFLRQKQEKLCQQEKLCSGT